MAETIISLVVGALISIALVMGVENLRRPRLKMTIEKVPNDKTFNGRQSRWLRLVVTNEALPWWAGWMVRESATSCRGRVKFSYSDNGRDVFGKEMEGRWASSLEPVPAKIIMGENQYPIIDPQRFSQSSEVEIPPGESEFLDVAARHQGEQDCYGWNNEAYFNNWRTPGWKLERGRYLVTVVVRSFGQKTTFNVYLDNNRELEQFRLEPR